MIQEIKHFQEYLLRERKDLKTIAAYCKDVELFFTYIKKSTNDIDEMDIEKYKEFLFGQAYKVPSINRKMAALNVFMKFSGKSIKIRQEKVQLQNFLDNVIEREELSKIIKKAEEEKDYRAKALLSTIYYTGMRISECLQLTIHDIEKDIILIRGKGNKYRYVFIPNKLRTIWEQYMTVRIKKTEKLFTGERGAITRSTSNKIFKKYAELVGVDKKKAHNHNLRHLYCRKMITKVDLATLADLAGHSDINITRRYLVKSKKELLDIVNTLD
ncbi:MULTISPECIES: tyrosine-type recombinase/integrase [unclassified Clostridium]|uniref:tyrosine-type recombinase/integrase n=1 Tax=unclassified Clostridium TaxID=2614128 RepID=UPI0025BBE332|nr:MULTISPECIES: tyrosine-type recombinase/integrase [unclassified Clostridium]